MKAISNVFGSIELGFLKSLIGQEFKFVGGPEAPDFLISDIFVLACSKSAMVVSGSIVEISGIDDFDDFSKMSVEEASADILAATLKSGNMFRPTGEVKSLEYLLYVRRWFTKKAVALSGYSLLTLVLLCT